MPTAGARAADVMLPGRHIESLCMTEELLQVDISLKAYLLAGVQVLEVEAMGDAGQPEGEAADAPARGGAGLAAAGEDVPVPGGLLHLDGHVLLRLGVWMVSHAW